MGTAASLLPSSTKADVAKSLKDEYEKLKAEGVAEEIIQARLTEKYHMLTKETETPTKKAKDQSKEGGLPKPPHKGKAITPGRRRSFGSPTATLKTVVPPQEAASAPAADTTNTSTAIIESLNDAISTAAQGPATTVEQKDNWDSVREQPYCNICKMAFKSKAFLDRHIKYSDFHAATVNKLREVGVVIQDPIKTSISEDGSSHDHDHHHHKHEESVHYRPIYCGSKFFWRTQEDVDFNFYYHIDADVIEVVPYDVAKSKEMPRLYFNQSRLKAEIAGEIEKKLEELTRDDSTKSTEFHHREAIEDDVVRICTTTFLLSHLHKNSDQDVFFALHAGESPDASPLLPTAPTDLPMVAVTRRRRTSSEEIDHTISSLNQNRVDLHEATDKADKIADILHQSVDDQQDIKRQLEERQKTDV